MSNIINNNFHNLRLQVNNDEYWDFFMDKSSSTDYKLICGQLTKKCLSAYIDMAEYDCVFENTINSLDDYVWPNAVAHEYTLKNIGYTGFDNGLLYFKKDEISNKDFLELYQHSTHVIGDDKKLILHEVTGSTQVYEYPLSVEDYWVKLNGGFYQGAFKTECGKYQTLPSYLENGDSWAYEFVLKKSNLEAESDKTLNDKHPNNKGIFFYIGTRAENKWIYIYDNEYADDCFTISPDDYVEDAHIDVKTHKLNSFIDVSLEMPVEWESIAMDDYLANKYYDQSLYNHSMNDDDYIDFEEVNKPTIIDEDKNKYQEIDWCCAFPNKLCGSCATSNGDYMTKCEIFGDDYVADIDDMEYETEYVEPELDISDFEYKTDEDFVIGELEYYIDTDNKFLLFDRTCSGFTIETWKEGSIMRYVGKRNTFNENLFLLMNKTATGYTVDNINQLKSEYKEKYHIEKDLWNNALAFRITDDGSIGYRYLMKDCTVDDRFIIKEAYSKPDIVRNDEWCVIHTVIKAINDNMVIRFYVNGNLVFVSSELPKINLHALDDIYAKQELVPYNISIGGGTQGLCDVILPNYMIEPYREYPIEKYFAGSFIGYLKSFKFYNCGLDYTDINNNFIYELGKLKLN